MRHLIVIASVCVALLLSFSLSAQETTPRTITYGQIVTGEIDNTTPFEAFTFEGFRGDYLSFRLRTTSGNLDPLLIVLDSAGKTITLRDDSRASLDPEIDTLLISRTETYQVVVARFGYNLGSTAGSYELLIERIGTSSESGTVLRYGDTITNTISAQTPELYYSFRALQGDVVNITMHHLSGDLDPYLQIVQVVNGQAIVILESDDAIPNSLDARIEGFIVPAQGTYYIVATRYGQIAGTSTGNFLLTLEEAASSGQGTSPLAALSIRQGDTVEGTLAEDTYQRYYRFEATQDDLLTIRMNRLDGDLDCYLILTDANLRELTFDDDSGEGVQNSLISSFRVPTTGTYYVIATRYQQAAGSTTGRYRLELEGTGNAFANVPAGIPRLSYGTAVTGTIDAGVPEVRYAFFAQQDEVVTVTMTRGSGDLIPSLQLLDSGEQSVSTAEATNAAPTTAIIDRFTISATGIYYVSASSFAPPGGRTSGSYTLVVVRVVDDSNS
ncbi:MAG: PPC domain-containing protein [bacterium]|nr:PPC domain-containing protein [bacterium]